MLSPEAELDVIVRALSESSDPNVSTHLSKREARRLVSQAVRATLAIEKTKHWSQSDRQREEADRALKLFLVDLDLSTSIVHSGV